MPRMTKTQRKRMLEEIIKKSFKVSQFYYDDGLSYKDVETIDKACRKALKKLK